MKKFTVMIIAKRTKNIVKTYNYDNFRTALGAAQREENKPKPINKIVYIINNEENCICYNN